MGLAGGDSATDTPKTRDAADNDINSACHTPESIGFLQ